MRLEPPANGAANETNSESESATTMSPGSSAKTGGTVTGTPVLASTVSLSACRSRSGTRATTRFTFPSRKPDSSASKVWFQNPTASSSRPRRTSFASGPTAVIDGTWRQPLGCALATPAASSASRQSQAAAGFKLSCDAVDALGVAPGERLRERVGELAENEAPLLHHLSVLRPAEPLVGVGREHEAFGIPSEEIAPLAAQRATVVHHGFAEHFALLLAGERARPLLFLRQRHHHVLVRRQDHRDLLVRCAAGVRPNEGHSGKARIQGVEGRPIPLPVVHLPMEHHRHLAALHLGKQPADVLAVGRHVTLALERLLAVGLVRMGEQKLAHELVARILEIGGHLVHETVAQVTPLAERLRRADDKALGKTLLQRQHARLAVALVMLPGEERHALDAGFGHGFRHGARHPRLDLRHGVDRVG